MNYLPQLGDKYVVVEDSQMWNDDNSPPSFLPAIITVEEVLADASLQKLNTEVGTGLVSDQIQKAKSILNTATAPTSLTFASVPVLYVGNLSNFSPGTTFTDSRSAEAFTPGLANVQMAGTSLYFPNQFGPQYNGLDVFEQAVTSIFPTPTFVDDWDLYHAQTGEVHCGTATKRQFHSFDWWTK